MQFEQIYPVIPGGMRVELPPLAPAAQLFSRRQIIDLDAEMDRFSPLLDSLPLQGQRIAITAGSRGIPDYVAILRQLVLRLQQRGAEPFIVPAMGSHGGATARGQENVLQDYGVNEQSTGAPIRASMETVQVGRLPDGTALHTDRFAAEADGIILFNKVKPHTAYKAPIESGLAKMLVIGLGKHNGARALHEHRFDVFADRVMQAARVLLNRLPILFGLAVVENAWGRPAILETVTPDRLMETETGLLVEAKQIMGRLLMSEIDVLIVDRIGKDVNGAGMDPNVTGRPSNHAAGFAAPPIDKIVVLGLTRASHGNGAGIGNADFTTVGCVQQLDFQSMYTNVFSARVMQGAKLPVVLPDDYHAIAAAVLTCNRRDPKFARIVRIVNTKNLHRIHVSPQVLKDSAAPGMLEQGGPFAPLRFDSAGNLVDDADKIGSSV